MPQMLIILLNFTVNYLLILATSGLCCLSVPMPKLLLAAAFGALHAALCLVPGFAFFQSTLMHILTIPIMGLLAFGRKQMTAIGSLTVLYLAVDTILADNGAKETLAGFSMLILLFLLLRKRKATVPVHLTYENRNLTLTALRDTGNRLRDPVTGAPVLVIGPKAAEELTGLTQKQLKDPVQAIGKLPGLRLIPYEAVGSSGFLLALRLRQVRIGTWQGSHVVAFAPEGLEAKMGFEALIGGTV